MARMGWRGCEDGVGESVGRRERWNKPKVELVEIMRYTWLAEARLEPNLFYSYLLDYFIVSFPAIGVQ